MQIQAVIFDLDNTLLNRRLGFYTYAERFVHRFIQFKTEEEKRAIIAFMEKEDRDGYRNKKELYTEILMNCPFKLPKPSVEQLVEYWFTEFPSCSVLMDGAIELLDYFKARQIKLGIITNGAVRGQGAKIDYSGLRHYFDEIIISEEVAIKKPEPTIFELMIKKLEVSSKTCLFVGDQPLNDIVGAQRAGIKGIWLEGFAEWDIAEYSPTYQIQSLKEIKSIV